MRARDDTTDGGAPKTSGRLSRLSALKAAAVGLVSAAGGAAFVRTDSAQAADGGNLILGQANSASSQTELDSSLAASAGAALYVNASAADYAIEGESGSVGVYGNGATGVMGVGDIGGVFSGNLNAVQLNPQGFTGEDFATAPHNADDHLAGDMLVDKSFVLWLCVADGTPGTWIKVSHGGVRPLDVPQRAYDSRNSGGIFGNGESRDIPIAGTVAGVPSNAVGVVGNVTITDTVGGGYLTIWPTGKTKPTTSNINWATANTTVANSFNLGVGSGGDISVITYGTAASTTQVIVDVTGYIL